MTMDMYDSLVGFFEEEVATPNTEGAVNVGGGGLKSVKELLKGKAIQQEEVTLDERLDFLDLTDAEVQNLLGSASDSEGGVTIIQRRESRRKRSYRPQWSD